MHTLSQTNEFNFIPDTPTAEPTTFNQLSLKELEEYFAEPPLEEPHDTKTSAIEIESQIEWAGTSPLTARIGNPYASQVFTIVPIQPYQLKKLLRNCLFASKFNAQKLYLGNNFYLQIKQAHHHISILAEKVEGGVPFVVAEYCTLLDERDFYTSTDNLTPFYNKIKEYYDNPELFDKSFSPDNFK